MDKNALIVHGGAPTAVINASLYGAVRAFKESGFRGRIFGARGGSGALLTGDFIDLTALPQETMERLPYTPASFIGTSRYPVDSDAYGAIVDKLRELRIGYLLFTGGNGSMDTCGKIARAAEKKKAGIFVAGIPKTIDNDIAVTDHAPGFGSAARFLAASVHELAADVASLPIHVCVVESMGRNAGWLTAAAALALDAGLPSAESPAGPHLIYVPELPFDEERFLDAAGTLYKRYGGVLVVVGEGLKDASGTPIVPPVFRTGRSVYYGDVSAHLAALVIRRLGIKARSEKPGILGRCSIAHQSSVDREEAVLAGAEAAAAVLAEKTGVMAGFRRCSDRPYRCEPMLIPVEDVMLQERKLPRSYVLPSGDGIAEEFIDWCAPLIGDPLPPFARP